MTQYPFVYFGHGSAYNNDGFYMVVYFQNPVEKSNRENILKSTPFRQIEIKTLKNYIEIDIAGGYDEEIEIDFSKAYAEFVKKAVVDKSKKGQSIKPTLEEWEIFEKRINDWVMEIHVVYPILFVVKSSMNYKTLKLSDWHNWSTKQYGSVVEPVISKMKMCTARDQINIIFNQDTLKSQDIKNINMRNAVEYFENDVYKIAPHYCPTYDSLQTIDKGLGRGKPRMEKFKKLPAFTQIVYLAWSGSRGSGIEEFMKTVGWEAHLKLLVDMLKDTKYQEPVLSLLKKICSHFPDQLKIKQFL